MNNGGKKSVPETLNLVWTPDEVHSVKRMTNQMTCVTQFLRSMKTLFSMEPSISEFAAWKVNFHSHVKKVSKMCNGTKEQLDSLNEKFDKIFLVFQHDHCDGGRAIWIPMALPVIVPSTSLFEQILPLARYQVHVVLRDTLQLSGFRL